MNYFTIKRELFLVPSNICNEEFEKIDKFLQILEKSGVGKIIEIKQNELKKSNVGRKSYNHYNLFATIIYCFSKFKSSLREIEELCRYDLRVMYIMEQETPDHSIIGKFINQYILPHQYEIFTKITQAIIIEYQIDISNQYLDGTKIEANANKYKFVWKPTTFHKRLNDKIKDLLLKMGYDYNVNNCLIKSYEFNEILQNYANENQINVYDIPSGKGIRLTLSQKYCKLGYQYLIKLLEYEEKEEICGENRNSYYKTDKDATAMALKTDYYSGHGTNMHAAYNIQVLVSSGLITIFGVFQERSDHYTLIPINDLYFKFYQTYPINLAADSGYGIYTNYKYMQEHNIGNYVKFQAWNGESNGKRPQLFHVIDDQVLCLNTNVGKQEEFGKIHQRNKDGKLFKFNGCNNCNYSYKCKERLKDSTKDYRYIELNINYEIFKEQARKNLLNPKGIEIRVNRSIQVEGTFGQIKQNMGYTRIRRRSLEKVSCEIMLMCLGVNIRKLFLILSGNTIKTNYWNVPVDLKKEIFPYVKQKKKD